MAQDSIAKPLTVAVFGDKQVGKTSLVRRFVGQGFSRHHHPTVEDYYEEDVVRGTNRCRHLRILDTTGSYDFPAMRQIAISKSEAFILVYSLDEPKSFDRVVWHRDEILKYKNQAKIPILVVCNKTDLTDISTLQAILSDNADSFPFSAQLRTQKEIVDGWDCKLMFTSAKVRWNINKVFYELVALQEEKNRNTLRINDQRRRSSLWNHIVFTTNRSPRTKLTRTRSLSA